jgi:ribonuclease P protein component
MSAPGVQTSSAPDSHRFPRTSKLLKHALFDQVYQRGQRHFSGLMTVFFLRRDGLGGRESLCGDGSVTRPEPNSQEPADTRTAGPRVGLTVGRVLGNSVVRNRIRRRMREAVRLNLHRLTEPVDVVINPKKIVLTAEFAPIVGEVQKAFDSIVKRLESGSDSSLPGPVQPRRHARRKAATKLGEGS